MHCPLASQLPRGRAPVRAGGGDGHLGPALQVDGARGLSALPPHGQGPPQQPLPPPGLPRASSLLITTTQRSLYDAHPSAAASHSLALSCHSSIHVLLWQDWLGRMAAVALRSFLRKAITKGRLVLRMPATGDRLHFGDMVRVCRPPSPLPLLPPCLAFPSHSPPLPSPKPEYRPRGDGDAGGEGLVVLRARGPGVRPGPRPRLHGRCVFVFFLLEGGKEGREGGRTDPPAIMALLGRRTHLDRSGPFSLTPMTPPRNDDRGVRGGGHGVERRRAHAPLPALHPEPRPVPLLLQRLWYALSSPPPKQNHHKRSPPHNPSHPNTQQTRTALVTSWIGCGLNFLRYRLSMDNSLAGSRSNIAAHYDIGNDLYTLMLDRSVPPPLSASRPP